MNKFEDIFNDIYKSESLAIQKSKQKMFASIRESTAALESAEDHLPQAPEKEYVLQQKIRPWFGKQGLNTTPIGTHPDFIELEELGDMTINQYACTIFVDIKGSTRLSLLYDLETVFKFKNAVLKACIEIIRSLDGHVHRLMGDATVAFFGRKGVDKEQSISDALNCSATLKVFLEHSVKPWMIQNNLDEKDFGFRIGCDFGNDEEVLWGNFGYKNVGEVSATGLPVDMASKLQGQANKNHIMLGQGLLDFVFWPEQFSIKKEKNTNGNSEVIPYVTPNITYQDGTPLNYRMKHLDFDKYIQVSALPKELKASVSGDVIYNPNITFICNVSENGSFEEYISASRYLEKHLDLEFIVKASTHGQLNFPLNVELTKTNYGDGVPKDQLDAEIKYLTKKRVSDFNRSVAPYDQVTFSEATAFRGLHTMRCVVRDNVNRVVFRDWIGIMIK
jgi:adenylate cyclase